MNCTALRAWKRHQLMIKSSCIINIAAKKPKFWNTYYFHQQQIIVIESGQHTLYRLSFKWEWLVIFGNLPKIFNTTVAAVRPEQTSTHNQPPMTHAILFACIFNQIARAPDCMWKLSHRWFFTIAWCVMAVCVCVHACNTRDRGVHTVHSTAGWCTPN